MATTTPNFGWSVPTSTDLVKDGATAIETLGDAIDASLVDLKGGTTGQILSKNSNSDMDFTWAAPTSGDITGVTAGTGISGGGTSGDVTVTNSMATALTTKGDIIVATGSGTFVRQGVGSNNQVIMADSVEADGVKWANEATATLTTTGDLLYASAANTLARRAIGSTGQVLTVSGGVPTWAAVATTKSFSQLSSASVGTGTTYTVSGLSGYDVLFFQFKNVSENGAGTVTFRFNSDATAGNYDYTGLGFYQSGSGAVSLQEIESSNNLITVALPNSGTLDASGGLILYGANTSGVKIFTSLGASGGATGLSNYALNGVYKGTSVISSVTLGADGNNFDAGTLTIWGAA